MSDEKKVIDVVVKVKGISLFGENKPKEKEDETGKKEEKE
tara:strand:+ start:1741 stop:1860 length:120 start_codon:yes stop_codon:yes gene_type:complete